MKFCGGDKVSRIDASGTDAANFIKYATANLWQPAALRAALLPGSCSLTNSERETTQITQKQRVERRRMALPLWEDLIDDAQVAHSLAVAGASNF